MINSLKFLIKRNFLDSYSSRWVILAEVIATTTQLLLYWYTAQAFGAGFADQFAKSSSDYFTYVIVGEVTLALPLILTIGMGRVIRTALIEGTLDAYLLVPGRPQTPFLLAGLAFLPKEIIRTSLLLLMAGFFFKLHVTALGICQALFLVVLSFPVFLGFGLLGGALMMLLGRGTALIDQFGLFATIVAGSYFPISVLPASLRWASQVASPYTLLLEATREVLSGTYSLWIPALVGLLVWGLLICPLGYWALGECFRRRIQKGTPIVLVP